MKWSFLKKSSYLKLNFTKIKKYVKKFKYFSDGDCFKVSYAMKVIKQFVIGSLLMGQSVTFLLLIFHVDKRSIIFYVNFSLHVLICRHPTNSYLDYTPNTIAFMRLSNCCVWHWILCFIFNYFDFLSIWEKKNSYGWYCKSCVCQRFVNIYYCEVFL